MNKSNQIKLKKPNKLSAFFICLLISILLWLLHSLNTVYTKQYSIPVKFTNLPSDKQLMGELPNTIKLNIKASGLKLLFLQLQEPFSELELNFSQLKSDEQKNKFYISAALPLIKQHLNIKTEIKRIIPDTLVFSNKSGTHKEVIVKVPLMLKYSNGYNASEVTVEPAKIVINGDETILKGIDTVYTSPLYLNDINSELIKNVNIINTNDLVYLSTTKVQVKIKTEKLIEKTLCLPIEITNCPDNERYQVYPGKVKLTITIGESKLALLDSLAIKAVVDVNTKKQNKLPINFIGVPKFVTLITYTPKEAEFLILKK